VIVRFVDLGEIVDPSLFKLSFRTCKFWQFSTF